jgi:hypothetical protein
MGRVIFPQLRATRFGAVQMACHQVKRFRSPFRMIVIARIAIA